MNKIFFLFAFVFSAFLLNSCEPNRAENGDYLFGVNDIPGNGGSTNNVTKLLKKVTALQTGGETIEYNYAYSSNKLISVIASDNSVSYNITYDGANISKIIRIQDDFGGDNTTEIITPTYSNGKLIKSVSEGIQSSNNNKTRNTTLFTYNVAGKAIKIVSTLVGIDISDPNTTYDLYTVQSDLTYVGNNISINKYTLQTVAVPPISLPPLVITTNLSNYDTFKNPFHSLPETFNLLTGNYESETAGFTGLSVNNYKTLTVDNESLNYNYTYDKEGYPLIGTTEQGVLKFEYQ